MDGTFDCFLKRGKHHGSNQWPKPFWFMQCQSSKFLAESVMKWMRQFKGFGVSPIRQMEDFWALSPRKWFANQKRAGGLVFRCFKDINSAHLAKLGWKLATEDELLWTKLMGSKYLKDKNFFENQKVKGSSFVCKALSMQDSFLREAATTRLEMGWELIPKRTPRFLAYLT